MSAKQRFNRSKLIAVFTLVTLLLVLTSALVPVVLSKLHRDISEGECEECHTGFEPYLIQVDSPTEVPEDHEFDFGLLVQNPWSHELRHLTLSVDLSDSPGIDSQRNMDIADIDETEVINAASGFRGTYKYNIIGEVNEARFNVEWDRPIVYAGSFEMTLTGPGGTVWQMDNTNSIVLSSEEVNEEGYGIYELVLEHNSLVRSTTATLTSMVDFSGKAVVVVEQIDRLGPGGSTTISVPLVSGYRGINNISYYFEATATYDHSGNGVDEDEYFSEGTHSMKVGDQLSYSQPEEITSAATSLWIMGRILGFIAALLLAASFLTGGSIKGLKRWLDGLSDNRKRWHCVISFATIVTVFIHLLVLYIGYYSGSWKGIFSGGIPLIFMFMVGFTGWQKDRIVEASSEKAWRRIHLWLSVLAVVLMIFHAVSEGTDLAFLRWW